MFLSFIAMVELKIDFFFSFFKNVCPLNDNKDLMLTLSLSNYLIIQNASILKENQRTIGPVSLT